MNSSKLLRVGMPVVGLCVFAVMQSGCQSEVFGERPSVPPAERDFIQESGETAVKEQAPAVSEFKFDKAPAQTAGKQTGEGRDFKYPRFQDTDNTPIYSAPRKASGGPVIGAGSVYVVRRGDSLSRIAARHRVRTVDLANANNLSLNSVIRIGQKLTIPGSKGIAAPAKKKAVESSAVSRSGLYVVRRGDSISRIAKRCKVKRADLMAVNNLTPQSILRIGQTLKLPGATVVNEESVIVEKSAPSVEKVDSAVKETASEAVNASAKQEDDIAKEIDGGTAAAETVSEAAQKEPAASVSETSPVVINQDIHVDDFCKQHNVSKADVIRLNSSVTENSIIKKNEVILLP